MKVFVAGATGAIGRPLVPRLIAAGHEVVAMTRTRDKERALREAGAEPVVADGLDRTGVMQALMRAEPEAVIHEMTGLSGMGNVKNFDKEFALTNRLRSEGTDHLLEAALAAGARRFVVQSFGNWNYERMGVGPKNEAAPFDPSPPAKQRRSLTAIRHLERVVLGADGLSGIALRYGNLYGPGAGFSQEGDTATMLRRRRFPLIGEGSGVWSFIHVDDAAAATVAALERGAAGNAYNVCDDDPAPVSSWLPELARAVDAPVPRHVPVWLGRLATGEVGVSLMTQIRGASNAKAKRDLELTLRYPSWREGFRAGLVGPEAAVTLAR
jgi:nucleoside-diphosphate-sugar epimerase